MEDGEIEDNGDEGYVVMARPEIAPPIVKTEPPPIDNYSDNSSGNDDSDTDSSDSHQIMMKRPKVKVEPLSTPPTLNPVQPNIKKKYNIWSEPLQEQVLTETLENFGVDLDPNAKDRSVESYNYKLGYLYNKNKDKNLDGGTHATERLDDYIERIFDKRHLGNKWKKSKNKHQRRKDKLLYGLRKLQVTPDNDCETVAKNIAEGLKEEKEFLISRVVDVFGKKRAIELYNQTRSIEADGGMLVMNQSRRRTPGGVFLKLVRTDEFVDAELIKGIFNDEYKAQNHRRKKLVAKKRRSKTQAMKEELISNGLLNNDLSDLLIKTDIKEEIKEEPTENNPVKVEISEEGNDEQPLTNPPPSPATDQDTPPPPHEQNFTNYNNEDDEDCLDIETDMDLL